MSPRPPDTLEVHVSFEVNRLAPVYLIDAYGLLVPAPPVRNPAVAASQSTPLLPISASEEKAR